MNCDLSQLCAVSMDTLTLASDQMSVYKGMTGKLHSRGKNECISIVSGYSVFVQFKCTCYYKSFRERMVSIGSL